VRSARAGNVKILRGPWNEDLFRVLEGFPELAHDDEVDACSGALEMLNPNMKGLGAPMSSLDGRPNSCGPSARATSDAPHPHGHPAPWNGSPSRRNRAEPSRS